MARHGFGTAFAAAFMAGLKQIEDERHNRALEDHWARVDNKQTAAEIEAAGAEAARQRGEAGYTGGGGGASAANVSKNLGANQNEAYQAAIDSGLSDSAARALVANMSGEALSDPSNVHQDGPHMAHGIVQWDDQRAARIEKQFGVAPQNMSVADQTKAAIWEMKTDPAYKASWSALNSNASSQDMVKTLVTNYERPGDPAKAINQRLQHLGALSTNLGSKAAPTTEVASSTGYQGSGAAAPKTETATAPTKGPNKDKTPTKAAATPAPDTVASRDGSYQVAGDTDIALTPEQAAKARADLEAHRAAPSDTRSLDDPTKQRPETTGGVDTQSASDPVAVPQEDSSAFGPKSDATPLMPPYPQSTSYPQLHTPVPPPQQGPPQRTGAPPNVGITPSAIPDRPVMGPDQRTGAPPNVGMTPSSVGDTSLNAVPMMPPRTTTPSTAYDPKTVQGPPMRADDGSRPDLTARSPASSANIPSKDAQPVSSPALPSNPRGNQAPNTPGFVQVTAPNSNPTDRNRPQMTALDLSHLWGPNPPLARQSSQQAPAPSPAPRPQDDWSSAVGAPDMDDASLGAQIMGNAKGGSIRRYAQGGAIPTHPTMKFAAAGAVPYATYDANPAPAMGKFNAGAYADPGYQLWRGGAQWLGSQSTSPYSAQAAEMTPGGVQANIDALPAYLKTWYNQQNADAMAGGGGGSGNAWYYNPASVPTAPVAPTAPAAAAPTPAAPAPVAPTSQTIVAPTATTTVTDPTSTTITGAPGLPNSIQAKSYDPNVDATTGAGFANTSNAGGTDYTVGAGGKLKQNSQGKISGVDQNNTTILSRKGGSITQRVNRYDDGGDVSPSAIGMPPGLGGQGAIPPLYFNPATYAGAGAPVGKGINQNSAGTMTAGAIPSLPMARGGSVAFADGGGVDEYSGMPLDESTASGTNADITEGGRNAAPAPAPDAETAPTPAPAPAPVQSAAPNPYATARSPQDVHPSLPAWTPQVKDADGNPSRGVIGAIAGGLKYLASQLGLGGGQQGAIAGDPNTSANRQSFASGQGVAGAPMPAHEDMQQIYNATGTNGLSAGSRTLAGMEAMRNFYLTKGDPDKADKMAASMMMYSTSLAAKYGDDAAKKYYDGDLHGAVNALNNASDVVGDGNSYKAKVSADGKTVEVSNSDLNGRELWKQKVAPGEILNAALGFQNGSLAWHAYEAAASKYDPETAQRAQEARQQRAWDHQSQVTQENWQHQQDVLDAKQQKAKDDAEATAKAENAVLTGAPQDGAPELTPTGNPPAPALPGPPTQVASNAPTGPSPTGSSPTGPASGAAPTADSAAGAQPATPPPEPEPPQTVGEGGYTASPLPSAASPANLPVPGAQDVSSLHADIGPPPRDPTKDPRFASLPPTSQARVQAAYAANYNAWRQQQSDAMKLEHEDRAAARSQDKLDQRERFTQDQLNQRQKNEADAKALATKTAEEHAARAPRPDADVHAAFHTIPDENGKLTGNQPEDYYKDQAATMPDGTINQDKTFRDAQYNQEFNDRNQRMNMNNALVNGYRYTHDADAPAIADALRGFAVNAYTATAVPVPADGYGQRYAVTFTRPSDGTQMAVVLPRADWANVLAIQKAKATAAAQSKADTAATVNNPYRAPPPSGESAGTPISKAFGWQRGGAIPSHATMN
jgi:hypothetical protein